MTHFISGMAQGVTCIAAAEIVLELKKQYPQITLECAIPYERQAVRWPEALRNRYFSIAERVRQGDDAANTVYAGLPEEAEPAIWWTVRIWYWQCAICGGTAEPRQTVWFAQNRRKPVWLVFPDTLELYVI